MQGKPNACRGCALFSSGTGFARTDGRGDLKVLVVAEALGREEALASKPLVGGTGKLFDRMVSRTFDSVAGRVFRREDFLLSNIVNCQPPGNVLTGAPYEQLAIDHCSPYLKETIARFQPKAILTMGNQPLRWFTGRWGIDDLRGYVFDTAWGPVIPTYHPSYIMRGNFELARVFQLDLQKAVWVARNGVPRKEKYYVIRPTLADAAAFHQRYLDAGMPLLSFDIETPYSKQLKDEGMDPVLEDDASYQVLRISFAFEEGRAISVPFDVTFKPFIRAMLATSGPKLVWNAPFDVPRLRANGCPPEGRIYDGMVAWHFLEPSLPMGLKYVATFMCPDMPAWKLMSKESPEWYNAADSDVALRVFFKVKEALERDQRWTVFERHCVDLLQRLDKVSERGINVDRERRATVRQDFVERFDATLAEIQPLIPLALKPKKVYKYSEERLKKEGLWSESMIVVQESLSQKEQERAAIKAKKEADRLEKKAAKAALRAAAKALREASRQSKSKRRKKASPATTAPENPSLSSSRSTPPESSPSSSETSGSVQSTSSATTKP